MKPLTFIGMTNIAGYSFITFYNYMYFTALLYEMYILCFSKKLFLLLRKTCIFVLLVTFELKPFKKVCLCILFFLIHFFPEI